MTHDDVAGVSVRAVDDDVAGDVDGEDVDDGGGDVSVDVVESEARYHGFGGSVEANVNPARDCANAETE